MLGIERPLSGEIHHVVVERGAEEQGLAIALARRLVHDPAHVRNEPHVEHPVRLVDDQHLDPAQVREALAAEVQEASRRRDENVDGTFAQQILLLLVVDAADQADDPGGHVLGQVAGVRLDLQRQLPGGRQHQCPCPARGQRPLRREFDLARENRDQERRGLAGTGLCLAGHIVVGQAEGQHLALDRRAAFET